jgi:hypothetical protein
VPTPSRDVLHSFIVGQRRKEINMRVLIGIDPHKATNAVAAIDERGELLEYAVFSTNRAGLCARLRDGANVSRSAAGRWKVPEGWGASSPCAWSALESWSWT